jgi:predicted TIM-barrel fold metal-dependent hydrolase
MTQLYAGRIVDPHHHLWDLGLNRHPWLAPRANEFGGLGDLAPLRRNYLPEDYLRDAARHRIVATVHVEAGWVADDCLGETRWLESIAKPGNVAERYDARVPLASPEAPQLAAAARSPNVAIKISDLVAYDRQWTLDSLREIVLHCIDCFGPGRAMFASDFPVAGLYATFDEVYGAFKTIVSGFSPREQSAMFFDNAKRIYRIDGASAP